jgi:hypothetical protein
MRTHHRLLRLASEQRRRASYLHNQPDSQARLECLCPRLKLTRTPRCAERGYHNYGCYLLRVEGVGGKDVR